MDYYDRKLVGVLIKFKLFFPQRKIFNWEILVNMLLFFPNLKSVLCLHYRKRLYRYCLPD